MTFTHIEDRAVRFDADDGQSAGRRPRRMQSPRLGIFDVLLEVPFDQIEKAVREGGITSDMICATIGCDRDSAIAALDGMKKRTEAASNNDPKTEVK